MITKNQAQTIERNITEASNPMLPPARRLELFFEAILIQKASLMDDISKVRRMWETAGMQAMIDAADAGSTIGEGGTYTARFIGMQQLTFLSYEQWLSSNVTATVDGQAITIPVTPLAIFENQPEKATAVANESDEVI